MAPPAEYDYIIVGAGSAGCVLAARLSEDPDLRVLLIEAGGRDANPLFHVPGGAMWLFNSPRHLWLYQTAPQTHLDGRILHDIRGRVLGGSSSVNGMLYCRGAPGDYDQWAAMGAAGWSYRDILPYFRRAQAHGDGADTWRGDAGPLRVMRSPVEEPLARAWLEAAQQAGHRYNPDINGERRLGVGPTAMTVWRGRRVSSAAAYLRAAQSRANLTVSTGTHATRIAIENGRATGVDYLRGGARGSVRAAREVILAAGTLQTPHLLLLSGIGGADALAAAGVAPAIDLPGVGENLHDHLAFRVMVRSPQPVSAYRHFRPLGGARAVLRYVFGRSGPIAAAPVEAVGVFDTGTVPGAGPDIKIQFVPLMLSAEGKVLPEHGFISQMELSRPESRGELTLRAADPLVAPLIDANYLAEPVDVARCIAGIKIAREIVAQPAFDRFRGEEVAPGVAAQDDTALAAYLRQTGGSDFHAVGTCRMGSDSKAVVDSALRVYGIEGLRVADASVMPMVPSGNTNAAVIMIAERLADIIRTGVIPAEGQCHRAPTEGVSPEPPFAVREAQPPGG